MSGCSGNSEAAGDAVSGVNGAVSTATNAFGVAVTTAMGATYDDVLKPVGQGIATSAEWVGNHPTEAVLIAGGTVLLVAGGVFAVAAGAELFETIAAAEAAGEYVDAAELYLKAGVILVSAASTSIAGGGLIAEGSYLLATEKPCQ